MKVLSTIIQPVVTEKSTTLAEKNIYAFWIMKDSTKIDVKNAVKHIYGADVAEVKITYVQPKSRPMKKGSFQKRKEMKKAYVRLKNNAKLDLTKFEKEGKKEAKVKEVKAKKAPAKKTTTKVAKKS